MRDRPVRQLDLQKPQYLKTASYGHFGKYRTTSHLSVVIFMDTTMHRKSILQLGEAQAASTLINLTAVYRKFILPLVCCHSIFPWT